MRSNTKVIGFAMTLVAVFFVAGTLPLKAGSVAEERKLANELDQKVKKATAEGFSGSLLLAYGSDILLDRGYGWADVSRKRRATPDTRYWVASISKQFTAAAILNLEKQGKLSTSDVISKFLPELPPDKAGITIHELLTHTSGIAQNYAADGISDLEEAVKAIGEKPLLRAPGQFHYANENYNLLSMVVQVACGCRFEDYLREQLFVPAGMTHSGFWAMLSKRDARETASVLKVPSGDVARPNWGLRGATGVLSTSRDLYRWQQALFTGQILSNSAREKMLRGYIKLDDKTEVGYGWYRSRTLRGKLVLWTRGTEDLGHNAIIKVYPDQNLVLIIASNAGGDRKAASRLLSDNLEEIIDNR
jgi:CubicO group peptidase (beta-lactamase class C family)